MDKFVNSILLLTEVTEKWQYRRCREEFKVYDYYNQKWKFIIELRIQIKFMYYMTILPPHYALLAVRNSIRLWIIKFEMIDKLRSKIILAIQVLCIHSNRMRYFT